MATPEEMLRGRMAGYAPLTDLVGQRIYPQMSTQEPTYPLAIYERAGEERQPKISGASNTSKVLIDVTTYGRTEAEYQAPAAQVVNALNQWSDRANGVQGVFHVDSNAGVTEDGLARWMKHTFAVWFTAP